MSSPTNKTNNANHERRGRLGLWLLLIVIVAGLYLTAANWRSISDWSRLRGYEPPAAVARLADQDEMTDYTRHLFYLNRPQLLSTVSTFRKYCPENKNTIVLGCYHSGQKGIYIYDVQDPALYGVQQVTAAHEVLHAVYARLSDKERQSLDRQLQAFYDNGLTDQRVIDEVKLYKQTEPNDVFDEMSCTFGTEVADLPPGLDAYYKRYFKDRQAIVAYEQRYQGEFTKRQQLIAQYEAQLSSLKNQITAAQADLRAKQAAINAKQSMLLSEQNSGDISAYNAGVPEYNRLVDAYNAEISSTKSLISQYNQLVDRYNEVARELAGLAKELDTRLTPQATR